MDRNIRELNETIASLETLTAHLFRRIIRDCVKPHTAYIRRKEDKK